MFHISIFLMYVPTLVRRSAAGDKRLFRISMCFSPNKALFNMYAIMGNHLKSTSIIVTHYIYSPICYDLFTQQIREALLHRSLFSMTSRRCKMRIKSYISISHKCTKPQVPQIGSSSFPPITNKRCARFINLNLPSLMPGTPHHTTNPMTAHYKHAPE